MTELDRNPLRRAARWGLWLLPVYALLLGYSTLSQQPDVDTDFAAYAEFVTTRHFLVSHLVASIGGAALAVVGVMAVLAFLPGTRGWRAGVAGALLTVVANVLAASAFGSAAFTQPGIGRAYLRGLPGIEELNADTAYGTVLLGTAGVSIVLMSAGAVLLGIAVARASSALRAAGVVYAAAVPVFAVAGILGLLDAVLQPAAGLALALASAVIAHRLPRVAPAPVAPRPQASVH